MNDKLNVIFDVSGSFFEHGKIEILKMLRVAVTRVSKNFGASPVFFAWREEIKNFEVKEDFKAHGTAEISALTEFFSALPAHSKILLVTDNFKSLDDVAKIKRVLKNKNLRLILMTVGAGAERSKNYNLSTVGGIFSLADLVTATKILLCDEGGAGE